MEGNDLQFERFIDDIYSKIHPKYFSFNPFGDPLASVLEEQIICRKKAADKLPSWFNARCLFATAPLEQATAESVALAKAALFKGKSMLSLTGGLGSDEYAFSKSFSTITGLDTDTCLNTMVRLNYKLLGCSNIERHDLSAEEFLATQPTVFDVVYIDPDRRPAGKRIAADARLYSPNVFELYRQYRKIGKLWLTKLSPMTDLTWIRRQFDEACRIYLFSFKNEIKELLVVTGDNVTDENLIVSVVDLSGKCTLLDKQSLQPSSTSETDLFYELSPSAIKAGFGQQIAQTCNWQCENSGTFFTGRTLINPALARCFILEVRLNGSLSEMAATIRKMGITQANLCAREFAADTEEVRKMLKLKDGGDRYIFFTGKGKQKKGFVCSKP